MKKLIFGLLLSAFSLLYAQDMPEETQKIEPSYQMGINFGVGMSCGLSLRPYINEEIAFRMKFKNGLGFDVGGLAKENVITRTGDEPIMNYVVFTDLYYKDFYIGLGGFFSKVDENLISPCLRTGFEFGNWNMGSGVGNVRVGMDLSATIYNTTSNDPFAEGLATFLGTVLNIPKLSIAFVYFLPF